MRTDKFYLDETGCYTTDITKAKAIISSNGVVVKPKCFVDKNLKIVSDVKNAVAIVNAYSDGLLQILLLESGGPVKFRNVVGSMCAYMSEVLSARMGCQFTPELPTTKTCLLANFMEEKPLLTSCHTKTDIVDRDGKVKRSEKFKFAPQRPSVTGIKRSIRTVVKKNGSTKPNTGYSGEINEECCLRTNSYPAVLISLKDFEAINKGTNFLRDYLYFCE